MEFIHDPPYIDKGIDHAYCNGCRDASTDKRKKILLPFYHCKLCQFDYCSECAKAKAVHKLPLSSL
jgi:hypothetical protein